MERRAKIVIYKVISILVLFIGVFLFCRKTLEINEVTGLILTLTGAIFYGYFYGSEMEMKRPR